MSDHDGQALYTFITRATIALILIGAVIEIGREFLK
jgi:hypothetical protein